MGHISAASEAFTKIYADNVWGNGSGVGSEPRFTGEYVAMLQAFLRQHGIRSVVDFGCGDWQFSQLMDWSSVQYFGFDVVAPLIKANQEKFGADNIHFETIRDGVKLPAADLLICKDVLQHLPNGVVKRDLSIFKRLYTHILITNDIYPAEGANRDIDPGQCRSIHLDAPPFNETYDVTLTWDVEAYGCHWRKQTCHLLGSRDPDRPSFLELRDEPSEQPLAAPARAAKQKLREMLATAPGIAHAVAALRKLLRGG